ncbi:MAG: hypothetical protein ACREA9_26755 [Pyrinomonadaceae bacterium]
MKSNVHKVPLVIAGWALTLTLFAGVVTAQTPSPSPKMTETPTTSAQTGEDAGDYIVTGSVEVGYRGLRVVGDLNKYRSDLNYKAGPRLFDSTFLMRAKEGKGSVLDDLLVTSSGWGADPHGQVRLSAEKSKWFRFDAAYRRFKYFRFLNNFANPNWIFSPTTFNVPPNPVTGLRGYDTRTQLGDFDLTLLPKNEKIKLNIGYSPERYRGPSFSSYHVGGNEFKLLTNNKSRARDFRIGADGRLGPIDYSVLQGVRLFNEDSFVNLVPVRINVNPAAASYTSYSRQEPSRGEVDFTRLSVHTTVAKKLDITGRLVHSNATQSFIFDEKFAGLNWNPRITGWPPTPPAATPNTLNSGLYLITGRTTRPNTLFDLGATLLATNKFRLSNTFRVETFEINGAGQFSDFFSITRGTRTDTIGFSNLDVTKITKYRKYQDTVEGDYQFSPRFSMHLGYRYGSRHIEEFFNGFNFSSQGSVTPPPARTIDESSDDNHTHVFLGGFKARPANNWTLYFDVEHGTADNVFTRIGNYDYTNFRAKSRYAPNRKVAFNVALITKNNANPSDIAGVSLQNFGVDYKSRILSATIDWAPNSRVAFSGGYTYNWVNSDSVIDFSYLSATNSARRGNALYFVRNHFFFIDSTAQLHPRVTLFAAYRVNKDNGQGDRIQDPTGIAPTLISSYPMSYQSPEARLAFRIHQRLDWNVGYQYYNYRESSIITVRPQNYHAHLPYTSLRLYFGRKE